MMPCPLLLQHAIVKCVFHVHIDRCIDQNSELIVWYYVALSLSIVYISTHPSYIAKPFFHPTMGEAEAESPHLGLVAYTAPSFLLTRRIRKCQFKSLNLTSGGCMWYLTFQQCHVRRRLCIKFLTNLSTSRSNKRVCRDVFSKWYAGDE
jgi:hypothetical protein